MAIPAASSRDVLMRLPVDNCCMDTVWFRSVAFKAACENSALTLVLITAILFSPDLLQSIFQGGYASPVPSLQNFFACTWTISVSV